MSTYSVITASQLATIRSKVSARRAAQGMGRVGMRARQGSVVCESSSPHT